MRRRAFVAGLLALTGGCAGAGVTAAQLRPRVAAELARVVVTRRQVAPVMGSGPVPESQVEAAIAALRARVAESHARAFDVPQLNTLRRFYSGTDGETVAALAFAAEGGTPKPALDAARFARIEAALGDPLVARSVALLRADLNKAFTGDFAPGDGTDFPR